MQADKTSRLLGLDGLRAIAVMGVLLFHADLEWARGGYLGVDLFFVISGFLITSLLTRESEQCGRINLAQFYWRRAKRLLPASWLMVLVAIIAAALLAPDALPRLRSDALASFAYITNWELIYSGQSYFESMGRQPLLLHLWSLAIEEQFYLFWAPLVFLVLPTLGRRALVFATAGLAGASIAWMALHNADITRLYFGTDTHGFGLLIGAFIGLLWRPMASKRPSSMSNALMSALGLCSLGSLAVLMVSLGEESEWLYPWGFLLASSLSALVIVCATLKEGFLGRLLDNGPMRWIGERSYGIYLWHWPIFMLTRPELDMRTDPVSIFLLRMLLTFAVAALSYRFVEMPIREGILGRLSPRAKAFAAIPSIGAAALVTTILLLAPSQATLPEDVVLAISQPVAPKAAPVAPAPSQSLSQAETKSADATRIQKLTAIGDSVLLGAKQVIQEAMPGAKIYAAVSKQAASVLQEIQAMHAKHALTPIVLIHLGTNGYVTEKQLRAMLSLLSEQELVIVMNSRVPRPWMRANNRLIEEVLPEFHNAMLANWNQISEHHPEYFVSDGVHLTTRGQKAFLASIQNILRARKSAA